jgi:hypothetical protein
MVHTIENIHFEGDKLIMNVDKQLIIIKLADVSEKLNSASKAERNEYKVSTSGYGIHWPKLDEDISIDGLLKKAK